MDLHFFTVIRYIFPLRAKILKCDNEIKYFKNTGKNGMLKIKWEQETGSWQIMGDFWTVTGVCIWTSKCILILINHQIFQN